MKLLFISLGCDKNLVDSEEMLGMLAADGHEIVDDEDEAEVIIVNTCCFIGDAKEESVNTILEMAKYKENNLKALIVAGCLVERYKNEILQELPEIDAIVTDSSCDLKSLPSSHNNIIYLQAPLSLRIGNKEFIDDENLDIENFMNEMQESTEATGSAAPSPQSWIDAFEQADIIFAITISSKLSGSWQSLISAKDMYLEDHPDKKIFAIDSKMAGSGLAILALKLAEYIDENLSYEEIWLLYFC